MLATERLAHLIRDTRATTRALTAALTPEDCQIQAMADASPAKWHLAHTTWFFEEFVLRPFCAGYRVFDERYGHLYNSYYETVAAFWPRPRRGLLSRPALADVLAYREHVDSAMQAWLGGSPVPDEAMRRMELGVHHEQQHQELLVTDVKAALMLSPMLPDLLPGSWPAADAGDAAPAAWIPFAGGVFAIGHQGGGFAFDNESPRHDTLLRPFALRSRLVTNAEVHAFIADGGYERCDLWLSEGWRRVQDDGWRAPLYWDDVLDLAAPAAHLSYFEAQAFACWSGARLPTEAEWEVAAAQAPADLRQLYGAAWQWTQSAYLPYPGFQPLAGSLGEYNGKFMCNQMVLRGSSAATPAGHARATYRNFFPPDARWQLTGVRLARDL